MRPIRPSPPPAAAYPRLRAAWRILLGAAPLLVAEGRALADTTVPTPGGNAAPRPLARAKGRDPAATRLRPHLPEAPQAPLPAPVKAKPRDLPPPQIEGGSARVLPPTAKDLGLPLVLQLHLHGPGEPCLRPDDEEVA